MAGTAPDVVGDWVLDRAAGWWWAKMSRLSLGSTYEDFCARLK